MRLAGCGLRLARVDLIIRAQQPKLGPRQGHIAAAVEAILGPPVERVGVKATTNEGLDAIGRGAAIAVLAAVLAGTVPARNVGRSRPSSVGPSGRRSPPAV